MDPEIVERHDGVFSTVMDLDAFFLGGHFIGNVRHPALLFVSIRSVPRRVHSRGLVRRGSRPGSALWVERLNELGEIIDAER